MAKLTIQKLQQNWEQLCNQLGDALHDPEKFDKICKATTSFNSTYKTWYISAEIVQCVGKKNRINPEFIIKKNREYMLGLFLEFYREKNPVKEKSIVEQAESKQQETQELKNDMVAAKEMIDSITLRLIDKSIECQELEDLDKSISELEEVLGNLIYKGENADKMIQGLKLIASTL